MIKSVAFDSQHILAQLRDKLPEDSISDSIADRELSGTDIFARRKIPILVVAPSTVDELVLCVREICNAGLSIVVKGGGASYTDAYLADREQTVCIDMRRLNQIVEIDEINHTVTVQAGCTWSDLHEALAARGWRTPFFGPFSGLVATVGGAMSQNAVSHGTGAYGVSGESVIAMDIVLANGEIFRTGSAAAGHSKGAPKRFFRHYGPDVCGLFLGDCGALGVKVLITLPIRVADKSSEAASFWFADFEALHKGMSYVSELGLDDENFGLDIALQQGQIARTERGTEPLKIAWRVFRSSPTILKGASALFRMALAGTRHLRQPGFTVHYLTKGPDSLTARARMNAIRSRATDFGREIPNTIATVVAAMPFAPLHNLLGPGGERWVPVHGILQHSEVGAFHSAWCKLLDGYQERLQAVGGFAGGMFQSISPSAFLYEIAFYWQDARNAYHESVLDQNYLESMPTFSENPEGRVLVEDLKADTIALFQKHNAAYLQLGKVYPYLEDRNPSEVALVKAIKAELDPGNQMNPGALGL